MSDQKKVSYWKMKYGPHIGTIISNKLPTGDHLVAVECQNDVVEKVNANDIIECSSELEQDYQLISNNIKAASRNLAEANQLAKKHNTSLQQMHLNDLMSEDDLSGIDSLFEQLEVGGWSVSSMEC